MGWWEEAGRDGRGRRFVDYKDGSGGSVMRRRRYGDAGVSGGDEVKVGRQGSPARQRRGRRKGSENDRVEEAKRGSSL